MNTIDNNLLLAEATLKELDESIENNKKSINKNIEKQIEINNWRSKTYGFLLAFNGILAILGVTFASIKALNSSN